MIKWIFNKMLVSMQTRYDYDVRYMQDVLNVGSLTFLKYMGFQTMATHCGNLSDELLYAVRLRAIIEDDCGPCTQLVVNMALEAGICASLIASIINNELSDLPEEIAQVCNFTNLVIARSPEAEDIKEQVVAKWGQQGLITIAFAISSYRVFPALKYTLGYGATCQRIQVNDVSMPPKQTSKPMEDYSL